MTKGNEKEDNETIWAHNTASLAFGGASRSCPGRGLAMVMMVKTLATVFARFEVKEEVASNMVREEVCHMLLRKNGVWVTFEEDVRAAMTQ